MIFVPIMATKQVKGGSRAANKPKKVMKAVKLTTSLIMVLHLLCENKS